MVQGEAAVFWVSLATGLLGLAGAAVWSSRVRAECRALRSANARLLAETKRLAPMATLFGRLSEGAATVDRHGRVTALTASFARFVPLARGGGTLLWEHLFDPAYLGAMSQSLERVRAGLSPCEDAECATVPMRGGVRWCRVTLRPLGSEAGVAVVTLSDCTQVKALQLHCDTAKAALDVVEDAVAVLQDDGDVVVWANNAFARLCAQPVEHLGGRCLSDLLPAQPVGEPMPSTLELVAAGGVWECEFRGATSDGELRLERRRVVLVEDDVERATQHVVVFKDLTPDLAVTEHLQVLSQVDMATELPNFYGFLAVLRLRLQGASESARLSVVHLDFHGCEALRETRGTAAVDAALRRIADKLSRSVAEESHLSRVGPAQLAFLLPSVRLETIEGALRALVGLLQSEGAAERSGVYLAVSIGVAPGGTGVSPENLLHAAQLTSARLDPSAGVNLGYFSEQLQTELGRRVEVEAALRSALHSRRDELVLHFQPKVDPYKQVLVGFEALCRWKSATLGSVSPGEFVPAAERSGLIAALGEHTFEFACQTLDAWRRKGLKLRPVAVNVSARQLVRENLADEFLAIARRFGIPPRLLELEITETAVMADVEAATRLLKKLRGAGFAIALDDFGTGQSSLSYLRTLPLDTLKIDRSFIADIESRADAAAICRYILDLGKTLRLKVVAEGVETPGQLEFLMQHRCDVIQGYVFSPAVPVCEAADMLAEGSARMTTASESAHAIG